MSKIADVTEIPDLTGYELYLLLKKAGLTQVGFARLIGRSDNTVYNWTLMSNLEPYQVRLLRDCLPRDLWEKSLKEVRRQVADEEADELNY